MSTTLADVEIDLPLPTIPSPNPIPCNVSTPQINLIGGGIIKPYLGPETPQSTCNMVEATMNQVLSSLTAVQPIFLLSDVILAVLGCIQAVPDSISSLSPQPILECIVELVEVVFALICAVYPPFAFPAMILSIIDFVIQMLNCVVTQLIAICEAQTRVANLRALVEVRGDPQLRAILNAAETNLECQQNSSVQGFEVVIGLVELMNSFGELANDLSPDGSEIVPVIPIPIVAPGQSCEDTIAQLQVLLDALQAFDAIAPDCSL